MEFDIAIIGAGPTGLSFALSLRQAIKDHDLNVLVIEKQSEAALANPAYDGREIALTHLSKTLLTDNGSWARIQSDNISPLMAASVLNGNSEYPLHFEAPTSQSAAQEQEPLGYLIANQNIRKAIFEEFKHSATDNITLMAGRTVARTRTSQDGGYLTLDNGDEIKAQLIVAADTRFSSSRNQMGIAAEYNDYGRSAVLCVVEHEQPNHHTALECFLYGGTLALLPLNGNRSSIVITVNSAEVPDLLAKEPGEFCADIERKLNGKLGALKQAGDRFHYPLVGVHARRFYANRFALIGDAAVGMHPVTAHGFNLGLAGQDILVKEISEAAASNGKFWSEAVLQAYQRQHMPNTRVLYHGTNTVVGLFTNDTFPAKLARSAMLRISNHLPPLKEAIRQKLMHKQAGPIFGLPALPRF